MRRARATGREVGEAAGTTRSLAARLRERIRREGPITFRDWMEAALYDPRGGYYRRRDLARWGRAGDYRTSPEASPLFAATFARYFAALHAELGSPARFHVCEAGAGRGLFARGVLETLERDHPQAFAATRYLLDDVSEDSRERAARALSRFAGRFDFARLSDRDSLDAAVVFSNELLDALPVHRVVRRDGRLRECHVGWREGDARPADDRADADDERDAPDDQSDDEHDGSDDEHDGSDDEHDGFDDDSSGGGGGRFVWIEGEPSTPRLAAHFAGLGVALAEGQAAEVNLAAEDWLARVAQKLTRGFVVTVDYGDESARLYDPRARPGGTLRAFRAHAFAPDALADPGAQDLTSTVNWTQLRRAGERAGLRTVLLERQDAFLLRAGFLEQLELASARAPDEAERAALRLSAREMILPTGMSASFQVLVQTKG